MGMDINLLSMMVDSEIKLQENKDKKRREQEALDNLQSDMS